MGLNNFFFIVHMLVLFLVMSVLQVIRRKFFSYRLGRVQIIVLLAYSYYFVWLVDGRLIVCVIVTSLITYILGIQIDYFKRVKKKVICAQILTTIGGVALILTLAYFKYVNFFIESINELFGVDTGSMKIILPVGISFFVFSALSYLIDIYRGTCEAERNIIDFCFFIVFFPKITAGPIVRWVDFKSQLKNYRGIRYDSLNDGIQIFMFGLFKKMVLADHLGVFVDEVFRIPGAFNTGTVFFSAISYSLQIYLDFSGYSDMAIGLSKIFGFDFLPNFNLPYISRGFSEFWGRWHISLSQWFRDYLYIPIGGSRKGELRTYINLVIVMLISGLWHGAGWTFIIWGLLHGIGCCITRLITKKKGKSNSVFVRIIESSITYIITTLFWTVFRAEDLEKLFIYWKELFTFHGGINHLYSWTFVSIVCVIMSMIIAIMKSRKEHNSNIKGFYPIFDLSKTWSMVIFFTFCGLTVLMGYYGNTTFIYGGF